MSDTGLVKVSAYQIGDDVDALKIERVMQMNGNDKWAVRRYCECLNKSGEWEWEPMPSGRDESFIERCRFDTAEQAISAALAAPKEQP